MSAYKQFLASDIIVAPLQVHKGFTFTVSPNYYTVVIDGEDNDVYFNTFGNPTTQNYPDIGIDRLLGKNITGSLFSPKSDLRTGFYITPLSLTALPTQSQYQRLVYNSIKELYYSNYQTSVYGDPVNRPVLIPGRDEEGNRYIGSASSQAHYDNYLQTTLTYPRFFPTASDVTIGVMSIPNTLFGDYIQPNSFYMSFPSSSTALTFTDDGEGNILMANSYYGTSSAIVGNIIYPHGIITLTGNETIYSYLNSGLTSAVYSSSIYSGSSVYGEIFNWNHVISNFVSSLNFTCSFSSSYTIYETQYKCTIRENEFNFTLNPSAISGSYNTGSKSGVLNDNITGSYFDPYITTIGLYDEQQNLLAIGKLAQPVPGSPTTDTTILINLDM